MRASDQMEWSCCNGEWYRVDQMKLKPNDMIRGAKLKCDNGQLNTLKKE